MRSLILVAALALMPATALQAEQAAKPAKQRGPETNGTFAISGLASAGRHCVTNGAASLHSLGWVPSPLGFRSLLPAMGERAHDRNARSNIHQTGQVQHRAIQHAKAA